ncbi:MAG TPA: SRPBCC domain-containing protein [Nitrososphaeraceae archaeon]|nr:SRPBCC domain-containing protein [Nitrososphaeraceae archaeon]
MSDKYDVLKKEIIINAPVEKVYSTLITPEQLTQWFPNIVTIEPKIGGKISFRFLKGSTQEDKDHEIVGEIVSFIPNKELSYTWNFTTKPEYNKNTIVTWKLEQLDKDKTKLTLIHSGFTNADRLQYDDHNKGWSWHIKRLENLMDKNTNANEIVMQYLQAVEKRDFESARKYVSDNISYEGPEGLGSFNKAEPYLKYLEHLNLPKADIKKKFVDDNDVCLISDMNFDKQSVTALIFSWYHVNDGKISSIRVAFDPRPFTQKK